MSGPFVIAVKEATRLNRAMPIHDPAFKQLLHTFFRDFIQAFAPDLHHDLDRKFLEFLDKELFLPFATKNKLKVESGGFGGPGENGPDRRIYGELSETYDKGRIGIST